MKCIKIRVNYKAEPTAFSDYAPLLLRRIEILRYNKVEPKALIQRKLFYMEIGGVSPLLKFHYNSAAIQSRRDGFIVATDFNPL